MFVALAVFLYAAEVAAVICGCILLLQPAPASDIITHNLGGFLLTFGVGSAILHTIASYLAIGDWH